MTKEKLVDLLKDEAVLEKVADSLLELKIFKEDNTPQVGDRCIFWNDDEVAYVVGTLGEIQTGGIKYPLQLFYFATSYNYSWRFDNCKKLTKEAE